MNKYILDRMNMSFSWTERIIWIIIWNILSFCYTAHVHIEQHLHFSNTRHSWETILLSKYAHFQVNSLILLSIHFLEKVSNQLIALYSTCHLKFLTIRKKRHKITARNSQCELQRISRNENLNSKHTQRNHLSALVFSIH